MILFDKTYDGESLVDSFRDVPEAFDQRFNPLIETIPTDEHNFQLGKFRVTIQWFPE